MAHIYTSILPYGYNEETHSYVFSLCFDLNPEVTEADWINLRLAYKEFITQFFSDDNKSITANFKNAPSVNVNGVELEKDAVKLCDELLLGNIMNNTLMDSLTNSTKPKISFVNDVINNVFFKALQGITSEIEERKDLPSYTQQITTKNLDTVLVDFKKAKKEAEGNGNKFINYLPNPTIVLENAINNFANIDTNRDDVFFNYIKDTALTSDIKYFKDNLNAISDFAINQNESQWQTGLQKKIEAFRNPKFDLTANKELHFSLFDSVDAMLDFWSMADANPLLQRITGKIIDFKIDASKLPVEGSFTISANQVNSLSFDTIEGNKNLIIQNLTTHCIKIKDQTLMVVDENPKVIEVFATNNLKATNYDIGGKLISVDNALKNYEETIKKLTKENLIKSQEYELRKRLIAIDSAALTTGVNIYSSNLPEYIDALKTNIESDTNNIYLSKIIKGYRYAIRRVNTNNKFTSLGCRAVTLKIWDDKKNKYINIALPKELATSHAAISHSNASHAFKGGESKAILDNKLLTWFGENIGMPSIFSNQENEDNDETTLDKGSVSDSTHFVSDKFSQFYREDYKQKGVEYRNDAKKGSAIQQNLIETEEAKIPIVVEYSLENNKNEKLIFGEEYEIIVTPEYKNGFAIPFDNLKNSLGNHHYQVVKSFIFKRNEPIKPVEFFLQHPIDATPVDSKIKNNNIRDGETLTHLVIRNFTLNEEDETNTTQQSIRHILPPAISFQQAFWYGKIFEMTEGESYNWYIKYHFAKEHGEFKIELNENKATFGEFLKDKNGNKLKYDAKIDLDEIIEGSTRMRPFYKDNCEINYLPDPLVSGFRFEFYKDKYHKIKAIEYEPFEQLEFYFDGNYPKINAYKIVIKSYSSNEKLIDFNKNTIIIRIQKGNQIFIKARTILDDSFKNKFETFGNYNDFTKYGSNDLLTPPLEFSVLHATQRPLMIPEIHNLIKLNRQQNKTYVDFTIAIGIEQNNIYFNEKNIATYIYDTMPTGLIELHAKWEDYVDDPNHFIADSMKNPNMPVNRIDIDNLESYNTERNEYDKAVLETNIDMANQLNEMQLTIDKIASNRNDAPNYSTQLKVNYDAKDTKFLEKYFWVVNKSKFDTYFPNFWGTLNENNKLQIKTNPLLSKNIFNRTSKKPFLISLLNTKKPSIPIIADKNITLVSVIDDSKNGKSGYRKTYFNRLRIYLERGRLTSGKDERIGIIVCEPKSIYNEYFQKNSFISKVGRDLLTDITKPFDGIYRNEEVHLTRSSFVTHDPFEIYEEGLTSNKEDIESFKPLYVEDLGLMTYLPKFNNKLNIWYVDVTIDIADANGNQLHNPFLHLTFVHYQPNSIHNNTLDNLLLSDCRISEPITSRYVYILPSRTITYETGVAKNDRSLKEIKLKVEYDKTSIVDKNDIKSSFYFILRQSWGNDELWKMVKENDKDIIEKQEYNPDGIIQATLQFKKLYGYEYQIVVLEIEEICEQNSKSRTTVLSFNNIINNKNIRIIQINTIKLF